jgi:hypothetical protein
MAKKSFDIDQRPTEPARAIPAVPIKPKSRRRRYAHTFSAGRHLKLIRSASGKMKWRRVPDGAIVHFGKQYSHRRPKNVQAASKVTVNSNVQKP